MDAGLAAVLGALAGSMATIGAAFATGWAQREGTRITARAAHVKDRRQPRHDAYRALIQAAIDLQRRVTLQEGYDDMTPEEVKNFDREITARWLDISLLGPRTAIVYAGRVQDASLAVIKKAMLSRNLRARIFNEEHANEEAENAVRDSYEDSVHVLFSAVDDLTNAVNDFAFSASETLDDDGTSLRREVE
jgi:hypothetical protein